MKKNDFLQSVGKKLKSVRSSTSLSQIEMAKRLDIDRSTYLRHEKNAAKITLEELFDLSTELHVPLHHLLPEEVIPQAKPFENQLIRRAVYYLQLIPDEKFKDGLCDMIISYCKNKLNEQNDQKADQSSFE